MIAIFSTDPILCRMLTLEAERGDFPITQPDKAALWLLDLDYPPRQRPRGGKAYTVGFYRGEAPAGGADLLLPYPYPGKQLRELLTAFAGKSGALTVTQVPGAVRLDGKTVHLAPSEERLLCLLLQNRGQTVEEKELMAALGDSKATTNVLQVHMYRLRRKLAVNGASLIRSVRGVGYRLLAPKSEDS